MYTNRNEKLRQKYTTDRSQLIKKDFEKQKYERRDILQQDTQNGLNPNGLQTDYTGIQTNILQQRMYLNKQEPNFIFHLEFQNKCMQGIKIAYTILGIASLILNFFYLQFDCKSHLRNSLYITFILTLIFALFQTSSYIGHSAQKQIWRQNRIKEMRKIKYKLTIYLKVLVRQSINRVLLSFDDFWKKFFYYPFVGILMLFHLYPFIHSCKNVLEENLVFTRPIFEIFKFNKLIGDLDSQYNKKRPPFFVMLQSLRKVLVLDVFGDDFIYQKLSKISFQCSLIFQCIPILYEQISENQALGDLGKASLYINLAYVLGGWQLLKENQEDLEYCRQMVHLSSKDSPSVSNEYPLQWLFNQSQNIEIKQNLFQMSILGNIQEQYAKNIKKMVLVFKEINKDQVGSFLYYCSLFFNHLSSIQTLTIDLRNSKIDSEYKFYFSRILLKLPFSPLKFYLNLKKTFISDEEVLLLASALQKLVNVVNFKLVLAENDLSKESVRSIFSSIAKFHEISEIYLDFSFNSIDLSPAQTCFKDLSKIKNIQIFLRQGNVDTKNFNKLFIALQAYTELQVLTLDMSENTLSMENVTNLAKTISKNSQLYKIILDFTLTKINDQMIDIISNSLNKLNSLQYMAILLSHTQITFKGIQNFAKILHSNQNISNIQLSLDNINLQEEGLAYVSQAIQMQKNLYYLKLDLKKSQITDTAATELLKTIQYQQRRFLNKYDIDLKENNLGGDVRNLRTTILQEQKLNFCQKDVLDSSVMY